MHINTAKEIINQMIEEKQVITWRGADATIVSVSYPAESADEVWMRILARGSESVYPLTLDQLVALAEKTKKLTTANK